jgi:hypothetical protein
MKWAPDEGHQDVPHGRVGADAGHPFRLVRVEPERNLEDLERILEDLERNLEDLERNP